MRPRTGSAIRRLSSWLVLLVLTGGCASRLERGFPELEAGLTGPEVEALLGPPSVVVPGAVDDGGEQVQGPRWQYGDNLSTMTTAAAFPRTVPDRVWVIWFDLEGRVLSWRPPIESATSSVESRSSDPDDRVIFTPSAPPRER